MVVHHLKASPEHWEGYKRKIKTSSVRKDDRGFRVGDICVIQLYEYGLFVQHEVVVVEILHILKAEEFEGLTKGYVNLSIKYL